MNARIDAGRTIEGVFEIYRDYAGVLLPAAAVVFVIEAVIGAVLVEIDPALVIVAIAVQVVISTLYTGMVVSLVSDVQDGRRDQSVEQLLRSVGTVLLPLIAVGILAGIGIAIGFFLLIVPGLILITIWAVVAPVMVVERPGVFSTFGRSRRLVKGDGWRVFGVIVLFFLILLVVGTVLGAIGAAAGEVGRLILDFVGSVITAPLVALAASVLYFQLRRARGEEAVPAGAPGVTAPPATPSDELRSPERPAGEPTPERPAGNPTTEQPPPQEPPRPPAR